MAYFNRVLLMGNMTRDPQLTYTPSQTPVVDFGLATNRKWTAQDGSQKEEVCFVDCRGFGRTAETINKYLQKGSPIFIEGRLSFDSWQEQGGKTRTKLRVTIERFQFLPSSNGGATRSTGGESSSNLPATQGHVPQGDGGIPEDEIPF